MAYLMGIDVGTTGTRAIVIDEAGTLVASATAEYPLYTPRPLWAEQDPLDWWQAAQTAVRAALARANLSGGDVQGIGLSQRERR